MNQNQRDGLCQVLDMIDDAIYNQDIINTFRFRFTKNLALKLTTIDGLRYDDALVLSSAIRCDVYGHIENKDDEEVLERTVNTFFKSFEIMVDQDKGMRMQSMVFVLLEFARQLSITAPS
jgi:hypothetical protein